jgi:hypothetical protein
MVTLLLFLHVIDLVTIGYIVTSTSLVSIALILYEKIAVKTTWTSVTETN